VPLLDSLAPVRSRRGRRRSRPAKLHGDKAYHNQYIHADLRHRRIVARLARTGIESTTRLGRHRWVIERTMSWLMRYRRLVRRYDRLADHFPRLRQHRLCPDLLPQTRQGHQMRHGLSLDPPTTLMYCGVSGREDAL
jgi:hypothetical protein